MVNRVEENGNTDEDEVRRYEVHGECGKQVFIRASRHAGCLQTIPTPEGPILRLAAPTHGHCASITKSICIFRASRIPTG